MRQGAELRFRLGLGGARRRAANQWSWQRHRSPQTFPRLGAVSVTATRYHEARSQNAPER